MKPLTFGELRACGCGGHVERKGGNRGCRPSAMGGTLSRPPETPINEVTYLHRKCAIIRSADVAAVADQWAAGYQNRPRVDEKACGGNVGGSGGATRVR